MVEEWKEMYFPEMEKLVENQPKLMKQLSMLMLAFEKEVIKIRQYQQDTRINLLLEQNKIDRDKQQIKSKPKSVPKEKRTGKSSNTSVLKLAEESPDIFSQTLREKRKIDDSMITSSPEAMSPSIKKKSQSSHRKTRITKLLKQSKVESFAPNQSNTNSKLVINLDEMIEHTPDVNKNSLSPILQNRNCKLANKSIKKKLFSKSGVKQQQNTTLTQMFDMYSTTQENKNVEMKNTKLASEHQSGVEHISENHVAKHNISAHKVTQQMNEPQVHVDDILAHLRQQNVEKENIPNNELTDLSTTLNVSLPKIHCKYCNFNKSPCSKHRIIQEPREPEATFAGFWDLDFTTMNEKARRNANVQNDQSGTINESVNFMKP